jgi:hypothetical protein
MTEATSTLTRAGRQRAVGVRIRVCNEDIVIDIPEPPELSDRHLLINGVQKELREHPRSLTSNR